MSDIDNAVELTPEDIAAKTNAAIAYGLMVAGFLVGITWFVGVLWAYLKKDEAKGTLFEDHYKNIITIFIWSIGLSIIGAFSTFIYIGILVLAATGIWSLYRLVKGIARLHSNKSFS